MNKQISIPGFIVAMPARSWERGDNNVIDGMSYTFLPFKPAAGGDFLEVCEHTLAFEIAKDFDPRPQQIKAPKAKAEKLKAEFSKAVMEINAQIQSLQAIEHIIDAAQTEAYAEGRKDEAEARQ